LIEAALATTFYLLQAQIQKALKFYFLRKQFSPDTSKEIS
jgi:hypothetical protein